MYAGIDLLKKLHHSKMIGKNKKTSVNQIFERTFRKQWCSKGHGVIMNLSIMTSVTEFNLLKWQTGWGHHWANIWKVKWISEEATRNYSLAVKAEVRRYKFGSHWHRMILKVCESMRKVIGKKECRRLESGITVRRGSRMKSCRI